jgi:hypothetical protein
VGITLWTIEHTFDTVPFMLYEVDVTLAKPLDDENRRFLEAVQRSANRVVRFSGSERSIRLTISVAGLSRDDAVRAAAREVASIFPASDDEKYSEPRLSA